MGIDTGVSNEERKARKLRREAQRAHEWRVQVWAQMHTKIEAANAALGALGADQYEPWEPNFSDPDLLHQYSTMTLTK